MNLGDFLVSFINVLIHGLVAVGEGLINLLPPSPFRILDNSAVADYLDSLNWIIPVSSIVAILEAWVVAIAIYYVVSIALRWIKAVK